MGLILDAGSGGYPLPQADVYCDLYFGDENPEQDSSTIEINGNFLICDLHQLPFRTKVFSHANCTHVLEHISNPQKGYAELRRVSKHGYLETPNFLYENVIFGWPGHVWYFFKRKGKLFFSPVRRLKVKDVILLPLGLLIPRPNLFHAFPKTAPFFRKLPIFAMSHRW